MGLQVTRWTVDYGEGRIKEVRIPHAWRQEQDVRWEGPAVYKTLIDVPHKPTKLRFNGVSYHAEVLFNGEVVATHRGIWDAFEIPLTQWRGKRVEVVVKVTKNGGESYPVKQTLSGFLPYVYHTFGGIFRPVEIVDESDTLTKKPSETEYSILEQTTYHQGQPLYIRGILHWGWYPELGHCHPTQDIIDREIDYVKSLGFNTMKFCLWLPPHTYLESLERAGMHAWIELPLWLPNSAMFDDRQIEEELESIVRQYAHHSNIAAWTVGCELSNGPREWREKWVRKVQALTGSPLVKDNSGGAEMYGGDPVEFGTFEDFHPYGDAHFFPTLLDSLQLGARRPLPILLGETNDYDVHRDLEQLAEAMPFWASTMKELNDQGVRWQYDIPKFLATNKYAHEASASGHSSLMAASQEKAIFIRKFVTEQMRSKADITGYVLTGFRDTPISSSGVVTDWGRPRYAPCEFSQWNSDEVLFLIPARDPRWTRGGNRLGYRDLFTHLIGKPTMLKVGLASVTPTSGALLWKLMDSSGAVVSEGVANNSSVETNRPQEVAQIILDVTKPGTYVLDCAFGSTRNQWTFHFEAEPKLDEVTLLQPHDQYSDILKGTGPCGVSMGWNESLRDRIANNTPTVVILDEIGTKAFPYWRESIVSGWQIPLEQALAVCPDQVIDPMWLAKLGDAEWLQTRVDTRTYEEAPYVARVGKTIITTYRPHGGHGVQPNSFANNLAGKVLLSHLVELAMGKE